ncbi:MAG: YlmC/YmxH family sporulation protein [Aminipila sp.]
MRLSEIGDKEIVDLRNGSRHGQLWDAEMIFEKGTGKIKSILVPSFQPRLGFLSAHDFMQLPWNSIVKIGEDIIIFESQ